ncbi:cytochrome P450 [Agromyces bracchium]|uniref:Cytochrome P450 n=1 Tax=Agromyces bracchium TaxID=88376 RepID=A0A6I3MBC9_9MICO|nr:cytochrome P450 [Agromyces bracchium]MTH69442.1 cytochrome P450 [Agromyces bracchium]
MTITPSPVTPTSIDPASITLADLERDPYAMYAALRASAPVAHLPALGEWLVTRWDDCVAIGGRHDDLVPGHEIDDEFFGSPNVLRIEGDEHRALRAGIDARLRPRVVNSYIEDAARPVVIEFLERIRPNGEADLTSELFERISVRVVGDQLGLADIDDTTLVRWFHTLSDGHTNADGDEERAAAASASLREIDRFLRDRVERLRREPDHSIIAHMLHGGIPDGVEPRGYDDVIASIRVIILGGFQEPGNAVANTFLGLFSRPEQLTALAADPERLAGPALQEGLRWIAPIGTVARTARNDITHGAMRIPAGARIQLAVASANRDESRYEDADRYDLDRMMHPNATFGYGEHYCAGHFLARGIGRIAIEETVRRLPGLRPHPERAPEVLGFVFRGAKHLPAVWDA